MKKSGFFKLFRFNKITSKQFVLSFLIFISFNGISIFLLLVQDIILRNFGMKFEMNDYMIAQNLSALIMLILTAGILIPIGEELFFRGLLIRGTESINISFSIFVSAFYFAINHSNPYRLITLFLFGLLIGLIVHYTNSLIPGIIFHILNNTVFEIYTYIQGKDSMTKQYSNLSTSSVSLFSNHYFIFLIFVLSCIACFFSLKQLKTLSSDEVFNTQNVSTSDRKRGILIIASSLIISTIIFIMRTI